MSRIVCIVSGVAGLYIPAAGMYDRACSGLRVRGLLVVRSSTARDVRMEI